MNTVCFIFIYLFEQMISYIFFSRLFEKTKKEYFICLLLISSFIFQFSLNFIGIPFINLLTFFICNLLIALIGFNVTVKQAFFNVLLLEGFMITTELIAMYGISLMLNVQLTDYQSDDFLIITETLTTKMLYFILVSFTSKVKMKQKRIQVADNYTLFLFILPLASILIIISFGYLSINYELNRTSHTLFVIISFILLFSNIAVFFVNDKITETLKENNELQLAAQKSEINNEYYKELERQYELSNILIHDLKRHLRILDKYSEEQDYQSIHNYIQSLYAGNEIPTIKQFSKNKLVNVIMSRYYKLCSQNNISFDVDIRNIDFSFISESDLTSLLDNLLENAVEAAKQSKNKTISLSIDKTNESFVNIRLVNSCDFKPKKSGGNYISSKIDEQLHGFGLKSINKIAKKYDGYVLHKYDEQNKTFYSSVIIKQKKNNNNSLPNN